MGMGSKLAVEQVDLILDLLRRETEKLSLTSGQRISYGLQAASTLGYVLAGLLFGLVWALTDLDGGWSRVGMWALVAFVFFTLSSLVLLVVNLIQMRRFRERIRLLKRFQLREVLEAPWRAGSLQTSAGDFWSSLGCLIGGLWSLAAIVAVPTITVSSIIYFHNSTWTNLVTTLLLATPGLLLVAFYLFRRARQRQLLLTDVDLLGKLLTRQRTEALEANSEEIELSPGARRKVVQFERERIQREREEAIRHSLNTRPDDSYSVLSSAHSLMAASKLRPDLLLAAQSLLLQLSDQPRPKLAEPGENNLWKLISHDDGVEIDYEIDEQRRIVRIHDIRATA